MNDFSAVFFVLKNGKPKYYYREFKGNGLPYPTPEDAESLIACLDDEPELYDMEVLDLCAIMDTDGNVIWQDTEVFTRES